MVELIAKKSFTYARRALRAGDRFDAHDADVRILLAIGHAEAVPEPIDELPPPDEDPDRPHPEGDEREPDPAAKPKAMPRRGLLRRRR